MTKRFTYVVRERTGLAWTGLASGLVMLALAFDRDAPPWAWIVLAPCIGVCVLQIALRPGYGIRLGDRWLSVLSGYSERRLPLDGVDHLRLTDFGAAVVLRSGDEVALPRQVHKATLALIREVTERGIPVRAI